MKSPHIFPCIAVAALATLALATGQTLPGSLSFTTDGNFANSVAESSQSLLYVDNDLTKGYVAGFDLVDAPTSLNPSGPAGSASFQWGKATSSGSFNYKHASALWYTPVAVTNAQAEQSFTIGYLNYRNGTISTNTGASSVDLSLNLSFSSPLGISGITKDYTLNLLNTTNGSDPIASADIVDLGNTYQPLEFTDANGNRYYLELTFRPDQTTIDGTLSTPDQFRVYEGGQGAAELVGRFTTSPTGSGIIPVPEPSSLLLGALGSLLLFRRRRA